MIEHDALADASGRMNVDLENARGQTLKESREQSGLFRTACQSAWEKRYVSSAWKPLKYSKGSINRRHAGSRLATATRSARKIWPRFRLRGPDLVESLMQETGVDRMLKPLCQTMANCVLEGRLTQDRPRRMRLASTGSWPLISAPSRRSCVQIGSERLLESSISQGFCMLRSLAEF